MTLLANLQLIGQSVENKPDKMQKNRKSMLPTLSFLAGYCPSCCGLVSRRPTVVISCSVSCHRKKVALFHSTVLVSISYITTVTENTY